MVVSKEIKQLKKEIKKRRRAIIKFINTLNIVPKRTRNLWIKNLKQFSGNDYCYDGSFKHRLLDVPFTYHVQQLWSYEYLDEIDKLDIDGYFNRVIRLRMLENELSGKGELNE